MASDQNGNGQPNSQSPPLSGAPGAFAYQTRLLERTTSLSRAGSISGRGLFPQPTGSATPSGTRRWTPSHRVANSMDSVRNRWEEKARAEAQDLFHGQPSPTTDAPTPDQTPERSPSPRMTFTPATVSKRHTITTPITTPILSQVTSNTTGVTTNSTGSSTSTRPWSPTLSLRPSSPSSQLTGNATSPVRRFNQFTAPAPRQTPTTLERNYSIPPRVRRSTLESSVPSPADSPSRPGPSSSGDYGQPPPSPSTDTVTHPFGTLRRTNSITSSSALTPSTPSPAPFATLRKTNFEASPTSPSSSTTQFATLRRPSSALGSTDPPSPSPLSQYGTLRRAPSVESTNRDSLRRTGSIEASRDSLRRTPSVEGSRPPIQTTRFEEPSSSTSSPSSSVMNVTPYRSSYMANKKAGLYGSGAAAIGRKLGRHLPRIASGDGNDDWPVDKGDDDDEHPVPRHGRRREAAFEDEPPPPVPPLEPKYEAYNRERSFERERERQRGERDKERERINKEREERERQLALKEVKRDRKARRGEWVRDEKPLPAEPMSPTPGATSPTKRSSVVLMDPPMSPISPLPPPRDGLVLPELPGDDVQGMRGRLRLSRKPGHVPKTPAAQAPATRFGLWADVQRHLLQAYEYLCHVGEAQQWIEGCLGEELGFGVVEMEEGLRNGVVLAKLARVWEGDAVVRRIYEHPKLSFRHSDNINIFLNFVRGVGLPECFIFELTDLYDKKNIPKVIYCIHALSHLLARRGMAERMGNLLGRLQFSDDQLRQTQKGLKDAGVPMPNFSNVGRELAREINEEPEETEEERRDRMLLEAEDSIIAVQTIARGFLARKARAAQTVRLRIAERYIAKMQAQCHGSLVRQRLKEDQKERMDLTPFVTALQAAARGVVTRRRWRARIAQIRATSRIITKVQAQARGVLQRRRYARLKAALRTSKMSFVKLQAVARAKVIRTSHSQLSKTFANPIVMSSVVCVQAATRGYLARRRAAAHQAQLVRIEPSVVDLQAHVRGVMVRRRVRAQLAKLDNVTDVVVRIQAAARAFLARRRLLLLIRALRKVSPVVMQLQAQARAKLLRQKQEHIQKSLAKVEVVKAVGGFQALARAAIARSRGREQLKQLEFYAPDVVAFQAACRGALVRDEFWAWRRYLHESQEEATYLQKLLRGLMTRRAFRAKLEYYRANLHKVVKIQALFRAKDTREQYRQLTLGKSVTANTIKNFVHLLDDSEADFADEIDLERMRKRVVEGIREVQTLENEVAELDVKIGLVVNNVKSFDEVIKARRRHGAETAAAHAARSSVLAAHGDPFAGPSALDASTRRKLELYQQLFYLLQTRPEYFARLFYRLSRVDMPDKTKRLAERVILTLFGFGQDRREEYLLLKLLQASALEEIRAAPTLRDLFNAQPMYMNVAVQYFKPKQVPYVKEMLQVLIRAVVDEHDLDLETDPSLIYRNRINIEEMQSGVVSSKPKDLPYHEAVNDPETRAEFIRHLQKLHALTKDFMRAITQSTRKMPYGMRCLARETLHAVKQIFPNETEETHAAFIGRLVYYRYIHPAIITPETFDVIPTTVGAISRKNLSQISKMLMQITSGVPFGAEDPCLMPLNDYVADAIKQMNAWFFEVADVDEAEVHFHAHEFLDVTVQPKPIYISPNEVYSMHTLLMQNVEHLAKSREDPLRVIISELDGVPHLGSDELKDARDRAVTLELTNRFANVADPHAEEKALWVQAKRGVLAILRVQPSKDLYDSLVQEVTDDHEAVWADIVDNQIATDRLRSRRNRRMPSTTGHEGAYRLDDIQSLSFREVKFRAISYLLELEKLGKVTRSDGYQAILNAIAGDVRSKHRKRLLRQQEIESMQDALNYLGDRKKYFEEQINSYHHYVENTMSTMQRGKGKKRFVMPFTKQFFHQRDVQRSGKAAQFGSFKYSAQELYDKSILLSMDQFSPRQFEKIDIVISSDKMHVFTMEIFNNTLGASTLVASTELRMEDLLQAQFENRISLPLFDGMVKVHVNFLLYQINKKFYV